MTFLVQPRGAIFTFYYSHSNYLEADDGPSPGDPVWKGDVGVFVQKADWLLGRGVELRTAVPCQTFDHSLVLS